MLQEGGQGAGGAKGRQATNGCAEAMADSAPGEFLPLLSSLENRRHTCYLRQAADTPLNNPPNRLSPGRRGSPQRLRQLHKRGAQLHREVLQHQRRRVILHTGSTATRGELGGVK